MRPGVTLAGICLKHQSHNKPPAIATVPKDPSRLGSCDRRSVATAAGTCRAERNRNPCVPVASLEAHRLLSFPGDLVDDALHDEVPLVWALLSTASRADCKREPFRRGLRKALGALGKLGLQEETRS